MGTLVMVVQLFFSVIIGVYFWGQLRGQHSAQSGLQEESKEELERINQMRRISLTEPLTEKTRPAKMSEIIGQEEGVKALKIALCGPNPQHVLLYGPPGVGKTAAARVALEEAKRLGKSPFRKDCKFVEIDATTVRYDERNIADPLIGSVHDPIYQGAGAYGQAGSPQPKEGAVSKAHGGILFIDEIGELQGIQINKLLKVLEDRKVTFESAYYSKSNKNIPRHVHDIFENGIPADFRLVGATTRRPEEIPPAIRSRCVEIFFRQLDERDIRKIIHHAVDKLDIEIEERGIDYMCRYAQNGRDAVGMVQTLSGIASIEERKNITVSDVEWVAETSRLTPRYHYEATDGERVGIVHGLAVTGDGVGMVISVEATAQKAKQGSGSLTCTGIMENETIDSGRQRLSRTSTARSAVDNVMEALRTVCGIEPSDYNIHINFPGSMMVDGPSAGVAVFCACYSAIRNIPINNRLAFTGEVTIKGMVAGVGGVGAKIAGAQEAGIRRVIIPKVNMQKSFDRFDIEIKTVNELNEVLRLTFEEPEEKVVHIVAAQGNDKIIKTEEENS